MRGHIISLVVFLVDFAIFAGAIWALVFEPLNILAWFVVLLVLRIWHGRFSPSKIPDYRKYKMPKRVRRIKNKKIKISR
ncbi:MAG: hypothetical protein V1690_02850 [Candidatus Moraniibacteriota bacterium]